ncbi:flagellar biosynthesis protein FlgN [Sulfitobacter sp. S0837]|uniref:flagellar biosynthesis protein FlgN n=1 Tax=Sulfitobacter maritimus TaxID=2741719 RepID=UPI00158422A1|nr:flagellar biosynthesis protein FlgN [Sulfitobacter maritimus]NUH66793.1 flagellar biosynthesis protein FlgN [Sulfitobacter maritimus]
MNSEETTQKLAALDSLLDAERTALLNGELEKLASMLEDKENLILTLNSAEHRDLEALQRLDAKVKRNQLLLDGALEGIRSVARRMAALRRIKGSLETYDSTGKKRNVEMDAARAVEKRA